MEVLNLLSNVREEVAYRTKLYIGRITKIYSIRVRVPPTLKSVALVLRSVEAVGKHPRKFGPNWEGPYYIYEQVYQGS